jgi:dihydrofolate reductase / thymidylate synthase
MNLPRFSVIIALDEKMGIGLHGQIPWNIPDDKKHFKDITTSCKNGKKNVVIMGRKTWDGLSLKPLADRYNFVLTTNTSWDPFFKEVEKFPSLLSALTKANNLEDLGEIFIIGGVQLYQDSLSQPLVSYCNKLYVTRIYGDFKCDTIFTSFPELLKEFVLGGKSPEQEFTTFKYIFETYESKHVLFSEEYQYLNLAKKIIKTGEERQDRTGVGTHSLFGQHMKFNIKDHFPLLTTKRVFWRGVVEELLWFLRGDTNAKNLAKNKVKIWNGNSSRRYLDSIGLQEREVGDCGPIYGFIWRHFGTSYRNCHTDYENKGYDQIKEIIRLIKEEPWSRRIILTGWNPPQLDEACLSPCHLLYQWYINIQKKELNCCITIRSNDIGLGAPFNIASASLLTYIFATICDLTPGELVYNIGDAHIYKNHISQLLEQFKREPRPFPTLKIKRKVKDPADYKFEDFELIGYKPHKTVKMKMAV